jgi:amidase
MRASELLKASQTRTRFYHHLLGMLNTFDVIALPVTQVWPFPIEQRWPQRIGARAMDTYHRWMEVTIYATLGGLPAISVPAGFHPTQAWPMGLQGTSKNPWSCQILVKYWHLEFNQRPGDEATQCNQK